MKIDCKKLKELLLRLHKGNVPYGELTDIVQLSRSIIQSYLGYFRNSVIHLCLHQGLTITDLAYDCIAEAFARDEKNKFYKFENFIHSLNDDLESTTEVEIFLAFKSFLTRIANTQLARLYAQSDPNGAKIYRNIRECLKRSTLFTLEKDYRGLVLKTIEKRNDHLEEFPREELEKEFMKRIEHQNNSQELLEVLHDIMINQENYRNSIPLVEVVQIFKRVYSSDSDETECYQVFSCEEFTQFEIKNILLQVEMALKEKIIFTYFAKGKLDRKESEAIFHAFEDIMKDWCNGEESHASLYDYLRQYISIDEQIYEQTLRTKMEYLLKIAREEFASRLMKEL